MEREHLFTIGILVSFSYNQSGKAENLSESRSRKGKLEKKLEKLESEKKEIEANIDKLRKDLSNQKVQDKLLEIKNSMTKLLLLGRKHRG